MSRNSYDPSTDTLTQIGGWQSVDHALSTSSTNPVANDVVTTAINTNTSNISANTTNIGSLASLLTTAKNNLVAAINELFNKANNKVLYYTSIACSATGSTAGNFATISNAAITANHVPVEIIFANPAAITSDVKCTTGAGSLTLNGICASATTATIILTKKDN